MRKKNRGIINNVIFGVCSTSIVLFFMFVVNITKVTGVSMEPYLTNGSVILTSHIFKNILYDDIVVFSLDGENCVKRVVALDGDKVELKEGTVFINGVKLIKYSYSGEDKEFNISTDELFVLGDNAKRSIDSRDFGPINIDTVISRKIGE